MDRALESHFGRPAHALGARCLSAPPRRAALAFAENGLTGPGGFDALRKALPSARLERCAASGQVLLECEEAELRASAGILRDGELLHAAWRAANRPFLAPELMGILNVTPDSFSDGGLYLDSERAIEKGLALASAGARWIDVGGESTRPGARSVAPEEELARVLPVIEGLVASGIERISVDTRRAPVARAAIEAGARMVNDVGAGLDDSGMLSLIAERGCRYVIMHRQGDPEDMQRAPRYAEPVAEVHEFLRRRATACLEAGIETERILIDPGIGFGKTLEHNLDLLRRLGELRSLGLPLLVGVSRKSFIAHLTGRQSEADWRRIRARDDPGDRLGGTAAAITFCLKAGADVLRVHDVAVMAEVLAVTSALLERPLAPRTTQP